MNKKFYYEGIAELVFRKLYMYDLVVGGWSNFNSYGFASKMETCNRTSGL